MNLQMQEVDGGRRIFLDGELCVHVVAELWNTLQPQIETADPLILDLDAVTACDAAGVQLVYAIVVQGRRQGRRVTATDATGMAAQCIEAAGISMDWLALANEEQLDG